MLDWGSPNHHRLHDMFDWRVPGVLRGEATPIYTYWPGAMERLQKYNPSAKLIVGLRHPTFRAFSHWRMETSRGSETLPFSMAIREPGRERIRNAPGEVHRVFSYVERGYYARQVRRMLGLFSRRQIFFFRTDVLWNNPGLVSQELGRFLGVPLVPPLQRRYVVPMASIDVNPLENDDRVYLDDHYRADIVDTGRLIDVAVTDWLEPSYVEDISATGS